MSNSNWIEDNECDCKDALCLIMLGDQNIIFISCRRGFDTKIINKYPSLYLIINNYPKWAWPPSSPGWGSASRCGAAGSWPRCPSPGTGRTARSCTSSSWCCRNLNRTQALQQWSLTGENARNLQLPTWNVQTWLSKGYIVKSIWQLISNVTLNVKINNISK